jgi:hypothetical protein
LDVLSQDFSQHVCDVHPAFQGSVDVLSHGCDVLPLLCKLWTFCHKIFPNTFAMSSRLFSEMWTFCHTYFWIFVMSCRLLSKLWMFCHRTYEKILMALSEEKKQEITRDSPFK